MHGLLEWTTGVHLGVDSHGSTTRQESSNEDVGTAVTLFLIVNVVDREVCEGKE